MRPRARSIALLSAATAVGVGPVATGFVAPITFTAQLSGLSGDISATIRLWASNDPNCRNSQTNAASTLLAVFTLSGTGASPKVSASDVWPVNTPYLFFWGEITAIAGNSADVNLIGVSNG